MLQPCTKRVQTAIIIYRISASGYIVVVKDLSLIHILRDDTAMQMSVRTVLPCLVCPTPVSYTHLDVYKRQLYAF